MGIVILWDIRALEVFMFFMNEDLMRLNWLREIMSDEQNIPDDHGYAQTCVIIEHMRPLLLAWIKFNPRMDK